MKAMGAAKFKERCLALLDQLGPDGLVITKRGKPVARVLPIARRHDELIGCLRGKLKVRGDLQSTGVAWEANP